jgi:hypothetical protein
MIDSVEPLSCVLWLVALFAAGMYPLGFMLGAPCSPCCGDNCDDVFDFNRCIRFVNNDQTEPPETLSLSDDDTGPLHGFSFPVTRPSDVGARRVAKKIVAGFQLAIRREASSMSDGETQTAVYRFLYPGLGDAIKWTITLQGVTMPLSPPQSLNNQNFLTPNDTPRTVADYMITRRGINTNAAPSVSVHSCSVVSGIQWLDGNAVTENTLKAMMTHTISNDPFGIFAISVSSVFSLNASVFQYVPKNSEVILRYVIEHARGTTRRYTTQQITIRKTVDADAIPEPGLAPLAITPTPYVDTPFTRTPPVFAGDTPTTKTATIYTDNVFSSESVTFELAVAFPSVELLPAGEQLHNQASGLPFQGPTYDPASFMYTNQPPYVEFSEFRWIMSPALGVAPYQSRWLDPTPQRTNNNWIYDHDLVESFLNGETTLPYDTTAGTFYTMQVSAPAKYCGQTISGRYSLNSTQEFSHVTPADTIERVVTCKLSQPPASANWNGAVADMPLKLGYRTTFFNGTDYYGYQYQCAGLNGINSLTRQISMRAFYCGDLLWVLENGPCRTTLTKPYASGWAPDEFTLGGDYTLPSLFGTSCPGSAFGSIDTVRELTAPRQGGVIYVEVQNPLGFGFGTFIRSYSVPENPNTYDVLYHVPLDGYTYITQAGYGTECRFSVRWLANLVQGVLGFQFESDRCPILGQVEHFQPSLYGSQAGHTVCDWSVTSSADWLIAEKVSDGPEEGLLKLSIDFTVEAIFNEISNTGRSAIITITSGGTTNTWEVRHFRT